MLERSIILSLAANVGLDACGVTAVRRLDDDAELLERWLTKGCNGSMDYMSRNFEQRVNLAALVDGAKTVVVGLMSYHKIEKQVQDAPFISQSGLSQTDYHLVVKYHLKALEDKIVEHYGTKVVSDTQQHIFCDSAPVLERRWAQLAGLGAIGKNHQLINPTLGSFVHIGILVLQDIVDKYDEPFSDNICKECDKCIQACPTGVLRTTPFDATKCVSYLTIERKEPLKEQYKKIIENTLYGCDKCAECCPYNQQLPPTPHKNLQAHPMMISMTAQDWQTISKRQKLKLLHRLAK